MKKYIDAQLQVVRISNNDVIATSTLSVTGTAENGSWADAADRFRDWEEY